MTTWIKKLPFLLIFFIVVCSASANDWNAYKLSTPVFIPNAYESYCFTEPTVMYEGGVYKMWVRGGANNADPYAYGVIYATSSDGITWTRGNGGNYIVSGIQQPFVMKNGSQYWLYAANIVNAGGYRVQYDLYVSNDGINFSLDTSNVLHRGTGSQWDASEIGNIYVWIEGTNWYAIYEGAGPNNNWIAGLATSSDGRSWTKDSSNPIHVSNWPVNSTTIYGGWDVHKYNGAYYSMFHGGTGITYSSDIWWATSTDLKNWSLVVNNAMLSRTNSWENPGGGLSQVADPYSVQNNGHTYVYFEAYPSQTFSADSPGVIEMADIPYPYGFIPPLSATVLSGITNYINVGVLVASTYSSGATIGVTDINGRAGSIQSIDGNVGSITRVQ